MKSYVSLEQKICSICGHEHDTNAILLDTRLKDSMEKHTITGFDYCEQCQEKIDEGFIAMVEVSNTDPGHKLKQSEAFRTGNLLFLKRELFDQIFNVKTSSPMTFVEPAVVKYLQSLIQQEKHDNTEISL